MRNLRIWAAAPVAVLLVAGAVVGAARAARALERPSPAKASVATATSAAASALRSEPTPAPAPPPSACAPEPSLAPRSLESQWGPERPQTPAGSRRLELPAPVELARLVREDPARLGSASIGTPTRGGLWGAVQLVASDGIQTSGSYPWGTESVVRSIERAVREVRRCFPDSPKLFVGDISRKEGGWLRPHRSHQSGLDADIGYYYLNGPAWFQQANASNLDRARTWALLASLIEGDNVESIFIDRSIQRLLREHAEKLGVSRARLDDLFESERRRHDVVIHHASGHTGHFHVRFRDPDSVALGVRLAPMLRGRLGFAKSVPPHTP